MIKNTFDILVLNARPASGKSEIIDYLKRCDFQERLRRFHIGDFVEIDDFPMLWTWFEEDELLEKMGQERLHSDSDGYFKYPYLWNLLIERMSFEYQKWVERDPHYLAERTVIFEFSRGSQHGGYASAYQHLSPAVVERMAILYLNVSFEESFRKNRKRYNPLKPDSILEHGLADEKMVRLYHEDDFQELTKNHKEFLEIHGQQVPYVVFENEDDVTTTRGDALGERLEQSLDLLWQHWIKLKDRN
ncbi:MAG: hypothetical protein BGO78_06530 [Chloroflexi bacterium 44-23]|nr:MAG: hypothetical protein BGO78_06530 [Chloroflexi bacterium 44-23]